MNTFMIFWKNKKLRQSVLLGILILILIVILINDFNQEEQPKSTKLLICKECRTPETRTYIDIKTQLCSKCSKKGAMLYSFKCSACDYEFGVMPIPESQLAGLSAKERMKKQIENKRCPNCKSIETYPLVNYKAIKKLQEKAKQQKTAE